MNRFQINPGRESDFEASWRDRQSYLDDVDGFVAFALLKNQMPQGTTEFISHTTWSSREAFDAWRASDVFRQAHAQAGLEGVVAGPPQIGLYESVIEEGPAVK